MAEAVVDVQSLRELFKGGWEAQKSIEKDEFSSNSEEFKVNIESLSCDFVNVVLFSGVGAEGYRMS